MATDDLPRLRVVSLAEVDDLAKLNEPVEPLARHQAMEIISDIKVTLQGSFMAFHSRLHVTGDVTSLDTGMARAWRRSSSTYGATRTRRPALFA